jgi:hypothetical protein
LATGTRPDVLGVITTRAVLDAAVEAAGCPKIRRCPLSFQVTAMIILGLCLFWDQGAGPVTTRLWSLLSGLDPALLMRTAVTAPAISKARARLPSEVMRTVFEATTTTRTGELALFGRAAVAADGTVIDLAPGQDNDTEFATPTGGRFPQARLVTLTCCGTRRILAATLDSITVAEQVLWDRITNHLDDTMIMLADRNFFSMHRWHTAQTTGAHLLWRVKNGTKSLPARIDKVLPDGSAHITLNESTSMLTARRKRLADKTLTRMNNIKARLVEFDVTTTDLTGNTTTSHYRILTTILDPTTATATQIAQAYTHRWQAETTYRMIKVELRGTGRRLRSTSPDQARQEIWGLLTIHNALVTQATTAATNLNVPTTAISYTAVLTAIRNHIVAPSRLSRFRCNWRLVF